MNQFISLFLPAILAIYTYEKLMKVEIGIKEWIAKYFILVLFINIINYAITIYIFKKPMFTFTNLFTLKYLILGIVVGIVLSFIVRFIEENIAISIRVDKNEK